MKRLDKDKHSSVLQTINLGFKKAYNMGPCVDVIEYFLSSLTIRPDKLEPLPFASFSSLV
jgi:hypothetical protein